MSSGAMINIGIALILTPIVTRMYSKEEFGVYYIFVSIITIGTMLINGMYPHAFVVPQEKKKFHSLLKLSLSMTFFLVGVFSLFLLFFGDWFLASINGEGLKSILFLIPVGLLISGFSVIFINWNIRRKEFKSNAFSNIGYSGSNKLLQIGYGIIYSPVSVGLVSSEILSKTIGVVLLVKAEMLEELKKLKNVSFSDMKSIAIEYKKYPQYVLTGNFVSRFTSDFPLYILSAYFGVGVVGAFGFANQIMNIPYNVMGNSIAPVFFQRTNELHTENPEKSRQFLIGSYNQMIILGSVVFGFIFGFGDVIFKIVFSAEWELAGTLSRIMSIYLIFKIISSPFSQIFRVVKKEEYGLYINFFLAFFRVLGIYVGIMFNDIVYAILFFSIGNIIGYIYSSAMVFKSMGIEPKGQIVKSIGKITIVFGMFLILRLGLEYLNIIQ